MIAREARAAAIVGRFLERLGRKGWSLKRLKEESCERSTRKVGRREKKNQKLLPAEVSRRAPLKNLDSKEKGEERKEAFRPRLLSPRRGEGTRFALSLVPAPSSSSSPAHRPRRRNGELPRHRPRRRGVVWQGLFFFFSMHRRSFDRPQPICSSPASLAPFTGSPYLVVQRALS